MRIRKRRSSCEFVLSDPIIIYSSTNCRIAPHKGFTLAGYLIPGRSFENRPELTFEQLDLGPIRVDVSYLFNLSVELNKSDNGVYAMNYFTETKTTSKLLMRIR